MTIKDKLVQAVASETQLDCEAVASLFETPPREDMGDWAFPCFRLAKTLRKAPQQIAGDLAKTLGVSLGQVAEVKAEGPYVNFYFNRANYVREFFEAITSEADNQKLCFTPALGEGKIVLIDFSSPNIAKPFHAGHGFSTFLGDAIANMMTSTGYQVVRLNYLGDYGTQFGKLISAWKRWGDLDNLEKDPIGELTRVYVRFHEEAEKNPEMGLEDEAREYFKRLEEGQEEEKRLWNQFREASLSYFKKMYQRLNIHFDNYNGESFYSEFIPAEVDKLRQLGLLELSEGAQVVRLDEFDLAPCLILKSNGTTTYASRDLASIAYRKRTWHYDYNLYVTGLEQKNHFNQVFSVLKRMGDQQADHNIHIAFGRMKFKGGEAFSTRAGTVIHLEDLINEAVEKTLSIIQANNEGRMSPEEMREAAEKIGIAAVKHTYLKMGRENNLLFDWEEMLDFEGDTAPYMLYTYARGRSILSRSGVSEKSIQKAQVQRLVQDEEFTLIKQIASLGSALEMAVQNYEPCLLTRQIALVARAFNRYYHNVPILKTEDPELREARLALCDLTTKQMKLALSLLGIETVERM